MGVRCIVIMGLVSISLMFQLERGVSSNHTVGLWCLLLPSVLLVALLGLPMARVSETFEYDVLRALNTPIVLKHAQRHLGQQLLPHLRSLGWGFRVGGSVIGLRFAMTILMLMITSMVGIVTRT